MYQKTADLNERLASILGLLDKPIYIVSDKLNIDDLMDVRPGALIPFIPPAPEVIMPQSNDMMLGCIAGWISDCD